MPYDFTPRVVGTGAGNPNLAPGQVMRTVNGVTYGGHFMDALTPTGGGMQGAVPGVGGSPPPGAAMQPLQDQAAKDYNSRLMQYQNLLKSIQGPKGIFGQQNALLDNFGQSGMNRIDRNEEMQRGQTDQDLISRGLGNTTIRSNQLRGVSRDAQEARTDLDDRIASQKLSVLPQQSSMMMQLFGMNPSLSSQQYIDMLTRLGSATGGV